MKTTILVLFIFTCVSCNVFDTPKEPTITDSIVSHIDTTIQKIDSSLVKVDTIAITPLNIKK